MRKFILKRLLISTPVLLGVTAIIFFLLNVVPGDPVALMMKEHISVDVVARVRAQMHLDDPAIVRYFRFLGGALKGDLGESYKLNRPVTSLILGAFPNTLVLAFWAALFAWIVGIPAGILSAVKKYSLPDNLFMGFSLLGVSMPVFWSALLFQYLFAVKLRWLPVAGFEDWRYVIMPAIVLGWSSAGIIARLTRSSLLEVMRNDYIRTARAKGLSERLVVWRHALKNAMLPIITIIGIEFGYNLAGAVLTESIFAWPGIGNFLYNAVLSRDYLAIQGGVAFVSVAFILINLLVDVMYAYVNPRIRY